MGGGQNFLEFGLFLASIFFEIRPKSAGERLNSPQKSAFFKIFTKKFDLFERMI
jgi:hypothetical protein